jgi:hypothetical protein
MLEKIFVIAKTYPTRSKKYKELVCTAGINERGEWLRIYPIPFRNLEGYRKFQKYTWIEAEVERDTSDPRPESHRINTSTIEILEHIPPDKLWLARRQLILESTKVYTNLEEIIQAANKQNILSLCIFKPTQYVDIEVQENQAPKPTKEEEIEFVKANRTLFDNEACEVEFTGMPYIPYKFKIKFKDDAGKASSMSVIDWEISQLYLKYQHRPRVGVEKVKEKLTGLFEKDLYLFLGTMRQMHGWTNNPYTIIGLFYPPKITRYQGSLF